jgi:hypothetical protein
MFFWSYCAEQSTSGYSSQPCQVSSLFAMQKTQSREVDVNPRTCILVYVDCCKVSSVGCCFLDVAVCFCIPACVCRVLSVGRRMPVAGVSLIKLKV